MRACTCVGVQEVVTVTRGTTPCALLDVRARMGPEGRVAVTCRPGRAAAAEPCTTLPLTGLCARGCECLAHMSAGGCASTVLPPPHQRAPSLGSPKSCPFLRCAPF
jgi:hypothetical protein